MSLFCALTSLTNIAGFIKPLQNFLNAHPKAASAITSLAPVILVALLTICICPILLLIANKAETINTKLGVHNSVLERFWKFLMVNGVVFFAVGQTAIEAYLTAFQTNDFDPLPIVASSFASILWQNVCTITDASISLPLHHISHHIFSYKSPFSHSLRYSASE